MRIQGTEVDAFTASYIETALWSSPCEEEPHPDRSLLDAGYSAQDIDPAALASMIEECRAFVAQHGNLISTAADDPSYRPPSNTSALEHAGHDFWLNRNGHGCGFWDGDWPEPAATMLDEASQAAGERSLYVGNDGRVYCCQG